MIDRHSTRRPSRFLPRAFAALVTLGASVAAHAQVQIVLPQDLCAPTLALPETITDIDDVGNALRVYLTSATSPPVSGPWSPKLVLIVNGNSYDVFDYGPFASFLAQQGFVVAVVERTGNTNSNPAIVIDALDATFAELGMPATTPVALMGHSLGGGIVARGAINNRALAQPYNVKAVVELSPNYNGVPNLTASDVSDLLVMYGSQDEDMGGTSGTPREAFAAYDKSGVEGSTTCNDAFCIAPPVTPMERTMVYIHGADHPGLIGLPVSFTGVENEFIDYRDQFCIAKEYVGSFLRWKLKGETIYKMVMRDQWRVPSVSAIVSSAPDYTLSPAGTPLRMYFQVSPRNRLVVKNFQDGVSGITNVSAGVVSQFLDEGDFATSHFVRHWTKSLAVGWPVGGAHQWAFNVTGDARDTTHFSHLGVRLGLLFDAPVPYNNYTSGFLDLEIGLYDGTNTIWETVTDHGIVGRNDRRVGATTAHSAMNTIAIPLSAFAGIDRDHVTKVYFRSAFATRGTLLIDNIELWKD